MRYLSENYLRHSLDVFALFPKGIQIIGMSVSLLVGLPSYWSYTNIDNSSSGLDIFLKFLGGILGTLILYFQRILIFLYVCQSVSWLTFLLKLDKYRDISSSVWDIFLKLFGGIPGTFVHLFQIIQNLMYVCQSVSRLNSLLKLYKYRDVQFWKISLSEIFWRHSWDVGTLIPNNSEILLCLSVCYLAYFLTEITQI